MNICILGGSGQVGSEVLEIARAGGHRVDSPPSSALDIRDADSVERFFAAGEYDLIVNCAAYTAVDLAEQQRDEAYAINAEAVAGISRAAMASSARLIHLSTDYVFDGQGDVPYTEMVQPNPQSVYGSSKLEGERPVQQMGDRGLVLRVSWVFGVTGGNFVKSILKRAMEQGELSVVDDQLGTPCSARSIARAVLAIAETDVWQRPLYHFGAKPPVTWHGFAEQIVEYARELGFLSSDVPVHSIKTDTLDLPAERPAYSVLDTTLFTSEFGDFVSDWRQELKLVLGGLASSSAAAR